MGEESELGERVDDELSKDIKETISKPSSGWKCATKHRRVVVQKYWQASSTPVGAESYGISATRKIFAMNIRSPMIPANP